jgi:hypothetical protein
MEPSEWNLPLDVWDELEKRTRPEVEYMTWYNKFNYDRFFNASEFHDINVELI